MQTKLQNYKYLMLICLEKHKGFDPTDPDVEEQLWPCPITMWALSGELEHFRGCCVLSSSLLAVCGMASWTCGREAEASDWIWFALRTKLTVPQCYQNQQTGGRLSSAVP